MNLAMDMKGILRQLDPAATLRRASAAAVPAQRVPVAMMQAAAFPAEAPSAAE